MPFPIPELPSTPISTEFFVPIPPSTAAYGQSIAQLIAFRVYNYSHYAAI